MVIWNVASVDEEPLVRLSDWQIVEIEAGTRHFVGYHFALREGRVSSAIVSFDPATRTGVTCSGRRYQLVGEPGTHPDAEWTLDGWSRVNDVNSFKVIGADDFNGD